MCGWAGAGIKKVTWSFRQEQCAQKAEKLKLVIRGSHMVSGTRCPAWNNAVKKWSESRAAAPKERYPVEHRGEFLDVLRLERTIFWPERPRGDTLIQRDG